MSGFLLSLSLSRRVAQVARKRIRYKPGSRLTSSPKPLLQSSVGTSEAGDKKSRKAAKRLDKKKDKKLKQLRRLEQKERGKRSCPLTSCHHQADLTSSSGATTNTTTTTEGSRCLTLGTGSAAAVTGGAVQVPSYSSMCRTEGLLAVGRHEIDNDDCMVEEEEEEEEGEEEEERSRREADGISSSGGDAGAAGAATGAGLVVEETEASSETATGINLSARSEATESASLVNLTALASGAQVKQVISSRETMEAKRERKAAKTLVIITGVFVVCWLPFFVTALVLPICGDSCPLPDLVFSVFLWLGWVNSMINPIIYTIFSTDFRIAFKKILIGRRFRSPRNGSGTGTLCKRSPNRPSPAHL